MAMLPPAVARLQHKPSAKMTRLCGIFFLYPIETMIHGVNIVENPVVVARVTVQQIDGREEIWAIPLRPSSAGPYYHWWIYLPEGARVIDKSVEVLPLG